MNEIENNLARLLFSTGQNLHKYQTFIVNIEMIKKPLFFPALIVCGTEFI
jgi:hypothetical protein